jgi:hypothetical protein
VGDCQSEGLIPSLTEGRVFPEGFFFFILPSLFFGAPNSSAEKLISFWSTASGTSTAIVCNLSPCVRCFTRHPTEAVETRLRPATERYLTLTGVVVNIIGGC